MMTPSTHVKSCRYCGKEFRMTRMSDVKSFSKKKYCSRKCATLAAHEKRKATPMTPARLKAFKAHQEQKRQQMLEGARAKAEKTNRFVDPEDNSDYMHPKNVAQRELNKAIDERHALTFEQKVYSPGDPEFEELAAKLMERRAKDDKQFTIWAEVDNVDRRRREDTTTLRG